MFYSVPVGSPKDVLQCNYNEYFLKMFYSVPVVSPTDVLQCTCCISYRCSTVYLLDLLQMFYSVPVGSPTDVLQ